MKDKDANALAKVMTECYQSNMGCRNLPVRMIVEVGAKDCDAEFVMLCLKHSPTYVPHGTVIQDQQLVTDEASLKLLESIVQ